MTTYISFLRGINVGGHRSTKMVDLRDLYASLGCEAVKTYLQSGNVVFQHQEANRQMLERKISDAIQNA